MVQEIDKIILDWLKSDSENITLVATNIANFIKSKPLTFEQIENGFIELTDEQRLDIMSKCCELCGSKYPSLRCQCWNED